MKLSFCLSRNKSSIHKTRSICHLKFSKFRYHERFNDLNRSIYPYVIRISLVMSKNYLNCFFNVLSLKERNQVKIVTSDLWESYRKLVKRAFPNAVLVADTFHFLRHLLWGVNEVRIRVMNAQPKDTYEYYLLKKHWKILTKYYGDLSYKHFYDHRLRYHIKP